MADSNEFSWWKQVKLNFNDGTSATVRLDPQTLQRLENGDQHLMEQIRVNLQEANVESDKTTAAQQSDFNRPTTSYCNAEVPNKVPKLVEEDPSGSSPDSITLDNNEAVDTLREEDTSNQATYTAWPDEAIRYLISQYNDFELDLEDPRQKKKDVWQKITEKMRSRGYKYSQNKVESKWRSLLKSHKDARDNKKRTGAKRKSFRYYEEIEEIISKRHDINPPFIGGSGCPLPKESGTTDASCDNAAKVKTLDDKNGDKESDLESGECKLSSTKGAIRKRENRKKQEQDVPAQLLSFMKETEEKRLALYQERQKERKKQEEVKIDLLKEIVSSLKK